MNIQTIALLILVPLLVWRVYSRVKKMMARQRSVMSRHWTGLAVFSAMVLVPASEVIGQPVALAWLTGGTLAGIAYGVWGLRLTRFEVTPEGYWFTPNARLGMLVAMLFLARLMYIGLEIFVNQGTGNVLPPFAESPLTLLTFGLFAGYFATYSGGMLRWRWQQNKTQA